MKKLLLCSVLTACFVQLKAQTLTQPLLSNKKYWGPYLKPKTGSDLFKTASLLPSISQSLINGQAATKTVLPLANASAMNYNMPIARVTSNDRMPIVKTDEPGMHYTMLIKGYSTAKRDSLVDQTP
jgi:hypothetical protein